MITEVCQMIRAIKSGDKEKGLAYAGLLAENLAKAGQLKESERITRELNDDKSNVIYACLD